MSSLRNKIIAWSFFPAAIILAGVALGSLYAYQRVTENLVIERDRDLTRLSASLLAKELQGYVDPSSEQFLSVFDSGMVVFDAGGKVLSAEPERIEGWGPDWYKRIPFRQMVRTAEPVFSDVVPGGQPGEKLVVVFAPITARDGETVGGVAGVFRLAPSTGAAFYGSIEKLRRGEDDAIYLVDSGGQVIYHSTSDYIGGDFSEQEAVKRVVSGEVGALRTRDLNQREIVASFAPVPDTTWGLITEEDWATLTQSSRRYGQLLLGLLALGVVVPALLVTVGVRRITRPIKDLIGAAREVAAGDFDQRIAARTGDELEQLAEQFNLMAAQLQESYDLLERKVASRTKELATLNTLAAVVSRSLDLEQVLSDALDEALGIMGLSKGQAFLLDPETQVLVLIAHRGLCDELVRYTLRLPLGASTAGLAAKEGRPVCRSTLDYAEDRLKALIREEGIQLVLSIPLLSKGRTLGAIDLGSQSPRSVSSEELSLLAAIGHQVGVAVENAQLYEQAQQLAVIKERNRLARDLHDSVMQALYGVTLYAEAAARHLALGENRVATEHLAEIQVSAQESLREMRLLIFELRPQALARDGLVAALRSRLDAVEGRIGMGTELEVDGYERLSADIEEGLYRVAQEALNNALRHAQARSVAVHLSRDGSGVTLEVADDGVGFDPETARQRGGLGLRGMEERAIKLGGELTVQSHPREGTRVRVEIGL